MSFTSKFGGSPQRPTNPTYLAIALAASETLVWPLETTEGAPYVASEIDVTPGAGGLAIAMPPASQGGNGIATIMTNLGAVAFTLTDNAGTQIVVLQPGVSWIISLNDNSTAAGVWRAYQLGATVSNANAGQLADNKTIQANGTSLRVFFPTNYLVQNTVLHAQDRGSVNVWHGSPPGTLNGTFQLDDIAVLTPGWFAFVANESAGNLTIQPTLSQTINGVANLVLTPGNTALISCSALGFNALGLTPSPLPVASGGTGAGDPNSALVNLGASSTGLAIFTAASAAAVLALLGLSTISFVESTIATNQTLNLGASQSCFVATAPLTLNLPLTTLLTTKYVFCVYAQGGAVTVAPNIADQINGTAAGTSFVVSAGTSAMFTTDANGHWWPFFTSTGGTVFSVGLAAPAEFTVSGSPVTNVGTLTFSKSNQAANTVWAGPPAGAAAPPGFRILASADGAVDTATVIFSARVLLPAGYLLCDGAAVSRTTFAALFNAITIQTIGSTTAGSPIITAIGTTANMQGGQPISGVGIPPGATILTVDGPTQIHLSANAFATNGGTPIVVAPFGVGDGVLSFNTPDLRGRAPFGADAMIGGAAANRLGNNASAGGFSTTALLGTAAGAQTHAQTNAETGTHLHTSGTLAAQVTIWASGVAGVPPFGPLPAAISDNANGLVAVATIPAPVTGATNATAAAAPMNITPPAIVLNAFIKT